MLRKANQKRSLDDIVIQKGEFDWRSLFGDEGALTKALGQFEDTEDARAAEIAAREEVELVGADEDDFGGVEPATPITPVTPGAATPMGEAEQPIPLPTEEHGDATPEEEAGDDEGGTTVDYMLSFVRSDMEFFSQWRLQ